MMGHKEKLKGGDEYDALTRARRYHSFRPGTRKRIKRKVSRRIRKQARFDIQKTFNKLEQGQLHSDDNYYV